MKNIILALIGYLASLMLLPVFVLWRWHERRVLPRVVSCDGGEGMGEG